MALIFVDGFDYYGSSGDTALRWSSANFSLSSPGRAGSGKYATPSGNSQHYKNLGGSYGTLILGFAYKASSLPASGTFTVMSFQDSTNASDMLYVQVNSVGGLLVTRGNGTVLGTTAAGVVGTTNWHYVELKAAFCLSTQTTGSATLKVDGVALLTLTGVTANNSTSTNAATASRLTLYGPPSTVAFIDDLYLCDTSGSVNNDFLGDVNIVALMPSGAGHLQQWANTGGANQAASVGNATEDGDTSYISDANVGDISVFTLGSLPTGAAAVKGVCVDVFARKDDAGTRQIAPVLSDGTTDAVGATLTMPSSYSYQSQCFDRNPATSADWNTGDFSTLQAGVKVIA